MTRRSKDELQRQLAPWSTLSSSISSFSVTAKCFCSEPTSGSYWPSGKWELAHIAGNEWEWTRGHIPDSHEPQSRFFSSIQAPQTGDVGVTLPRGNQTLLQGSQMLLQGSQTGHSAQLLQGSQMTQVPGQTRTPHWSNYSQITVSHTTPFRLC